MRKFDKIINHFIIYKKVFADVDKKQKMCYNKKNLNFDFVGVFNLKTTTRKVVIASMMAAVVCVMTMLIKIPSPFKGYLNLGDSVVLLAGWILSPWYGALAAGCGSALADVFSGYAIYVPATFMIKGAMALVAYAGYRFLSKRYGDMFSRIFSGILAEIIMVLGYFLFEGFLYGFAPSLANVAANGVQGLVGLILGLILIGIFKKNKIDML